MAGYCLLPLPPSPSPIRCCVVSSGSGASQLRNAAEGLLRLRSLCQRSGGLSSAKAKGRAGLMIVAVNDNHLGAKVSNLTIDMAQIMKDVAIVSTEVEVLQQDVTSLKANLNKCTGAIDMLRASGDSLDNHVLRQLERYDEYHERYKKPTLILIMLVLVLDLVLEAILLMKFLE